MWLEGLAGSLNMARPSFSCKEKMNDRIFNLLSCFGMEEEELVASMNVNGVRAFCALGVQRKR